VHLTSTFVLKATSLLHSELIPGEQLEFFGHMFRWVATSLCERALANIISTIWLTCMLRIFTSNIRRKRMCNAYKTLLSQWLGIWQKPLHFCGLQTART